MEGVVYELFVSPGMAVPPDGNVYHRYCPLVAPETETVTAPAPHELPLTGKVGAAGIIQNGVALVAVFPPIVTVIVPLVAPKGTVVVILVGVLAVTTAVVPLNSTILLAGVRSKFVPVIVTGEPIRPDGGVKLAMVGAGTEPQIAPLGESPVIVHPLVVVKFVLAAKALVPYCLPVAPSVLPFGVDGLALQPIKVAE
jgi:hypothetical protein